MILPRLLLIITAALLLLAATTTLQAQNRPRRTNPPTAPTLAITQTQPSIATTRPRRARPFTQGRNFLDRMDHLIKAYLRTSENQTYYY